MNHRDCILVVFSATIGFLAAIYSIAFIAPDTDASLLLIFAFGGTSMHDFMVLPFIFSIVPLLLVLSAYANIIRRELDTIGPYTFSRSHHRSKWFMLKAMELSGIAFIYTLMYNIIFIGIILLYGSTIDNLSIFFSITIIEIILNALYCSFWIILANILSIWDEKAGSLIVIGLFVFCQLITYVFFRYNPKLSMLLPSVNSMLILHDWDRLNFMQQKFGIDLIGGLTIPMSIIGFIVLIVLLVAIGSLYINKYEFL